MKSKYKYIIIGIIVIVAAYYARVIVAAKNLLFSVGGIRNLKISQGVITWRQIIRVTNGENVAIPITSANIENRINQTTIGKTILANAQTIEAQSTSNLELDVYIPLSDLIGLGLEVFNTIRTRAISIQLAGNVRALGFSIPVNESFNLNLNNIIQ
jgi:LEA14-like dessication related protein